MKYKLYKHPKYGHVYGPSIKAPKGRFSWPALTTPKDPPPPEPGAAPGTPRYELTLLLDKKSDKTVLFFKHIAEIAKEMETLFNQGRKGSKVSLGEYYTDGDDFIASREDYAEKYPYYKGKYVIVVRNAKQPQIFGAAGDEEDEGGNPVLPEIDPSEVHAGMKGRVILNPLFTAHGVSYKLEAVQVLEDDGTRYGGGAPNFASLLADSDEDEFGDEDTEDDDDSEDEEDGVVDDNETEEDDEEEDEEEEDKPIAAKATRGVKKSAPQAEVNLAAAKGKSAARSGNMKAMLNKL